MAVLVEHFPPSLGSDRRIYEIMKRLAEKHEIHFIVLPPFRVLCGNLPIEKGNFYRHFNKNYKSYTMRNINAHFIHVPIRFLHLWRKSFLISYILSQFYIFFEFIRTILTINPFFIIINYPSVYTGVMGLIIGKFCRKYIILDFNDLIAEYTIELMNMDKDNIKTRFIKLIQKIIVKYVDKVIVTTNFIKQYTLNIGVKCNKIRVISNGADIELFNPSITTDNLKTKYNFIGKKICMYTGRIDTWAGINIIKKLLYKLQYEHPEVKFLLLGSGEKKAQEYTNAIILEELQHERIPKMLSMADVVLVPFPEREFTHAASPLKLFEAMAMEKPVVASKLSGIEDIITHLVNGILVDPNNIDEWSEAILFLLNSEFVSRKIGEKARDTIEKKYDWDLLSKDYEHFIIGK